MEYWIDACCRQAASNDYLMLMFFLREVHEELRTKTNKNFVLLRDLRGQLERCEFFPSRNDEMNK